jgi:excisionase family DNA binding protein
MPKKSEVPARAVVRRRGGTASPDRGLDVAALVALPGDALLTQKEAALYLGVTYRWIRRHVIAKSFTITRTGKQVRIRKSALDEYLDRQTEPAREEVS